MQITTPGLQLVLDPLLYLQAAEAAGEFSSSSNGTMPRLIHMTMRSKHRVQPHQARAARAHLLTHRRGRRRALMAAAPERSARDRRGGRRSHGPLCPICARRPGPVHPFVGQAERGLGAAHVR